MSSSLNKLGAKAYPLLNLLAKRIEGKGYDINYKLLDLSVGSDLKLKYSGRIQLAGQRSSATFESGKSVNLSGASNGFSDSVGLLNTTELKKLLDANGDGKATIRFDQAINQANFVLEYGLYANLVSTLEVGKFNASIGAEINFPGKKISAGTDLVDISLYKKQKLQLLKDFKVVGGSKTISLPTSNYQFSKIVEFSIPTNADDLIGILGLNPSEFYTVRGTANADNLVTRTERGNDTFIGGNGRDTMTGGLGDDTYYLTDAYFVVEDGNLDVFHDFVIEDASAGVDTIIYDGRGSFSLEDYSNVEVLDLRTTESDRAGATGNSLNNTIYASDRQRSILRGLDGNDILIGKAQNDELIGGEGNDTLVGGGGENLFLFDFDRFNTGTSVDIIKDFKSTDTIWLRASDGSSNTYGDYGYDFVLGTAATTSIPTVIYNQSTGQLFADSDGTGNSQPQLFAILENRPTISSRNIF
jgi:Ca2+-binding RTX toxin-like protein